MNLMCQIQTYLEIAYYLSGIVVAAAALLGLRQLRIMKADILARNIRAAREKAIEASTRYLTETIKYNSVLYKEYLDKKIPPSYKGPIGNFTSKSLPDGWYEKHGKARMSANGVLNELNSLESVAAMFTTGVADSETGFHIIGRSYCSTVESKYDIISVCRDLDESRTNYWENIVSLYKAWSPKFTAEELAQARKDIDSRAAGLCAAKLDTIHPKL